MASADGEPDALYPAGDGAFEFERTVSRLWRCGRNIIWLFPILGGVISVLGLEFCARFTLRRNRISGFMPHY